jgi:hypothetical protein
VEDWYYIEVLLVTSGARILPAHAWWQSAGFSVSMQRL